MLNDYMEVLDEELFEKDNICYISYSDGLLF